MPDTTTPTAAEVMGWVPWDDYDFDYVIPKPDAPPSDGSNDWRYEWAEMLRDGDPEVDDMLAWLREQPCTIWAGEDADTPWLVTGSEVKFHVIDERDGRTTYITAPTLHAALEQAVIAVGRAE